MLEEIGVCFSPTRSATDEGRAMMQLIHDVAPGSAQVFHSAFNGPASFAKGIEDLANLGGADVIVDDVIYLAEPMFQDGIIAQAVDTVKGLGVSYFSAAGNNSRDAYESLFRPSGSTVLIGEQNGELHDRGEAHDFDPGSNTDIFQSITVPEGSGFFLAYQWDEPFFSVSGAPGSASDLGIFITNEPPTALKSTFGTGLNFNVGDDPVEVLVFFNFPGSGETDFNILLLNHAGPNPELMKYVRFDLGPGVVINEYDTSSGTIYGHANAAGAEAVGAAFYGDTPEFDPGLTTAILERFSSAGPTPILFNTDGTKKAEPDIRQKPEIVAPDGTITTFFGNFFGTSAAAPHAAAVAALMLEVEPGLSPDTLMSALEDTAIDMGEDGTDFDSGFGSIQADLAMVEVDTTPPVITLVGSDPVDVELGGTYDIDTDAGATASDNVDGDITEDIVVGGLPVDTSVLGPHFVTYDVSDVAGNPATQVTRTVNVVDTTAPVILLLGSDQEEVEVGGTYDIGNAAGATASDNVDGDISGDIAVGGLPVDTSVLGPHTVTYNVSDAAGNPATQVTRTVNVVDTAPPTLFLPTSTIEEATGPAGAAHTFSPGVSATDVGNPSPVVGCDQESGSEFPLGVTAVNCSANDAFAGDAVSWWPAEGNADDAADGNDGVVSGGAGFEAGRVGQAFSFDGVDGHVQVADSAYWAFGDGDFTIEGWVRVDDTDQTYMIVSQGSGAGDRMLLFYGGDNNPPGLGFTLVIGGSVVLNLSEGSKAGWNTGSYRHVALVRQGDSWNLHVDGDPVGSSTFSVTYPDFSGDLMFGYQEFGTFRLHLSGG